MLQLEAQSVCVVLLALERLPLHNRGFALFGFVGVGSEGAVHGLINLPRAQQRVHQEQTAEERDKKSQKGGTANDQNKNPPLGPPWPFSPVAAGNGDDGHV